MTYPALISILFAGGLAIWLLGGIMLRIGGLLLFVAGLAHLAMTGTVTGLAAAVVGAGLWLAGQWLYALRHQEFKSPLARQVFGRWAPSWLDPTRDWSVPTTSDSGNRRVFGDRGRRR